MRDAGVFVAPLVPCRRGGKSGGVVVEAGRIGGEARREREIVIAVVMVVVV